MQMKRRHVLSCKTTSSIPYVRGPIGHLESLVKKSSYIQREYFSQVANTIAHLAHVFMGISCLNVLMTVGELDKTSIKVQGYC